MDLTDERDFSLESHHQKQGIQHSMSLLQGDTLTQISFSVFENKGVFAVLLGSGLSRSAEIPTGWEITLDLVRRVAKAQGVADQTDWAKWYSTTTGKEPNYSDLLEEIASTPDERRAILHSYIEPTDEEREQGKKVPTPAHHAIAALVRAGFIRVIITTNFDRLMENALREQGIEPTVVASEDALKGAEPLTHSQCYLVKLHGDYKDARILNTDSELSIYPASYDRLLDCIFDEHGLIVCGWSGEWDHALRSAFLRAPNRRYPVYWALRGEAGQGAQALIQHRSAKQFQIEDADMFFQALGLRVQRLQMTQSQSPVSIDFLVSKTKRLLQAPDSEMQLEELFSAQMQQFHSGWQAAVNAVNNSTSDLPNQDALAIYAGLAEPLVCLVALLGRWSGPVQKNIAQQTIHSLYLQARLVQSGERQKIDWCKYPATLAWTAYGLGLVHAQKWDSLFEFLAWPCDNSDHPSKKTLLSALALPQWRLDANDPWLEHEVVWPAAPMRDALLEWTAGRKIHFAPLEPEFELLFEKFEAFVRIYELQSTDGILIKTNRSIVHPGFPRPIFRSLVAFFRDNATTKSILKAKFARENAAFLASCILRFEEDEAEARRRMFTSTNVVNS